MFKKTIQTHGLIFVVASLDMDQVEEMMFSSLPEESDRKAWTARAWDQILQGLNNGQHGIAKRENGVLTTLMEPPFDFIGLKQFLNAQLPGGHVWAVFRELQAAVLEVSGLRVESAVGEVKADLTETTVLDQAQSTSGTSAAV